MRVSLVASAVSVGCYSLFLARDAPGFSFAGSSLAGAAALLGAAWLLALAGGGLARSSDRRRAGVLVTLAAIGWLLAEWDNPESAPAVVFSLGLVFFAVAPAVLAHAVVTIGGVDTRTQHAMVASSYLITVVLLGLAPALWTDPTATGCVDCSRNLWLIANRPERATTLAEWGFRAATVWAAAAAGILVWRVARSSAARFRTVGSTEALGCLFLLVAASTFATGAMRGYVPTNGRTQDLWWASALLLAGIGADILWGQARNARLRRRIARLVVDLESARVGGGIEAAMARLLHTNQAKLAFPVGPYGYVDLAGNPVELADWHTRASLVHAGQELAVVQAGGATTDMAEVADGLHLSLQDAGLRAQAAHQARELQAARLRIVEGADAERRRLERDLHDGAQTRLVALLIRLRLAAAERDSRGAVDESIRRAVDNISEAIDQLRAIARGVNPSLLQPAGLAAALESLAESEPLTLRDIDLARTSPALESTAYLLVVRALRRAPTVVDHWSTTPLTRLELTVSAPRVDLGGLDDRVATLGGTLRCLPDEQECVLIAELPGVTD